MANDELRRVPPGKADTSWLDYVESGNMGGNAGITSRPYRDERFAYFKHFSCTLIELIKGSFVNECSFIHELRGTVVNNASN